MLAILLLHIIITMASLLAGFLFYNYIIGDAAYEKTNNYRPVIFYLITGLIVLTGITQPIILFLPATPAYKIVIAVLLITATLLARKKIIPFFLFLLGEYKKLSVFPLLTFLATWLLIIIINTGPTMMDDTESYHLQMVKWIQDYGSVPGLANLHSRFGFNSSWFSSVALFGSGWKGYNFYTTLNGVLSVWFAGYLLALAGKSLRKGASPSLSFTLPYFGIFVIALISWPIIRGNPSTANYDFIALLIIFVLFSEALRASLAGRRLVFECEWIIWPAFLFTVRLTNCPFLLLTALAFFQLFKQKEWRKTAVYFSFCLLLVIPFLVRNVIVSGYLFYPSLYFDWLPVDWKADKEKTLRLLRFIKYYNRVDNSIQSLDITEAISFPGWLIPWFKYMLAYSKVIFIPGIAGIILSPFLTRRLGLTSLLLIRVFWTAIILQLLIWLCTAPDPRFIYGCLLAGILLLLFILLKNKFVHLYFTRLYKYSFIVLALVIAAFAVTKVAGTANYRNWLLPLPLPSPPVKNITIDHIQLHIPEKILNNWNPRCYATDLPCLYEADPRLQLRGDKISDGFRLKK